MSSVIATRRDGVLELSLNDPEYGNAIGHGILDQLEAELRGLGSGDGCVLLSAQGKHFCVGGNIAEFGDGSANLVPELATHLHEFAKLLRGLAVPVVSAVQGAAAGAGFSLACWADIIVCSPRARFKAAYNQLGLTPDGGLTWLLPRAVGPAVAYDLLLTDRTLDAEEALRLGLVSRVVPEDELADAAHGIAATIAAGSHAANARTKGLLARSEDRDFAHQLDEEQAELTAASDGADGREGVAAFLARRPPVFERPGT